MHLDFVYTRDVRPQTASYQKILGRMSDLITSKDTFSKCKSSGYSTKAEFVIVTDDDVKIEPESDQIDALDEIERKIKVKCGEIYALFSGGYILVCSFCDAKFSAMQLLGDHLHEHHSEEFIQRHEGTEDAKTLPPVAPAARPVDSSQHININNPPVVKNNLPNYKTIELYVCDDCGVTYKNRRNLVRHRIKTGCGPKKPETEKDLLQQSSHRIHCEICGISYKNRRNLVRHQKKTGCNPNSRDCFTRIRKQVKINEDSLVDEPNIEQEIIATDLNATPFVSVTINYESPKKTDAENKQEPDKTDAIEIHPKHIETASCDYPEIDGKTALEKTLDPEGRPYTCSICGIQFECERWLNTHMKKHPANSTKSDFLCIVCDKEFNCKKALANHHRRHKQYIQTDTADPKELSENESNTIHNPELFCELCSQYFKNKISLFIHADSHETLPAILQSNMDFLKCTYCYKEFTKYADRKLHESTHTSSRPYECPYCHKGFVSNMSRKSHFRIHTGESPYQCDRCPKVFRDKYDLRRHIERHLNIRNATCEICDKRFYHKHQLELHMRTHTKERPYVCEDCGKTFVVLPQLKDHQLRHKGVKNVKCEVCGRLFYSRSVLKVHMASHSDEKPFECNICGRRFSRAKAMQKHMKLHSGVKKYVCNICGKAYAQDSGLYAHKKSHTRQF